MLWRLCRHDEIREPRERALRLSRHDAREPRDDDGDDDSPPPARGELLTRLKRRAVAFQIGSDVATPSSSSLQRAFNEGGGGSGAAAAQRASPTSSRGYNT